MSDTLEGRVGQWMQTYTGKAFFPLDMRQEDFCIDDLANGNALDTRYNGQGSVRKFYSVAEHQYHGAWYALYALRDPMLAWAFLFHDIAEGLLKDLSSAVKAALFCQFPGGGENVYKTLEANLLRLAWERVGLTDYMADPDNVARVKELDARMIANEKPVLMKVQRPWFHDCYEPLPGVLIECWEPEEAKRMWASMYYVLAARLGKATEEITFD